jgi:DNA-binding MarR family transcriptional regulator
VASKHPSSHAGSLSFLLSQIGARSAQLFAERLAQLDLTARAYAVISNVCEHGAQTQQQLANALGMHRNNMVGLIDELEDAGRVVRVRSVEDRRSFEIHATPTGRALVDQVRQIVSSLDAELSLDLDGAQARQLSLLLQRVATTVGLRPGVHPHLAARRP